MHNIFHLLRPYKKVEGLSMPLQAMFITYLYRYHKQKSLLNFEQIYCKNLRLNVLYYSKDNQHKLFKILLEGIPILHSARE